MAAYRMRKQYENISFLEEINFQHDAVCKFIDSVEVYAIPILHEKKKRYEDLVNQNAEYDNDYYLFDAIMDETIYGHFNSIFFTNAIISTYSYLERTMLIACRANENGSTIKIKDIAGKGIIKYRTYLEKVVGLSFKPIENEWAEILKLNKIRNHVIHELTVHENNLNEIISSFKNLNGVRVLEIAGKYSIEFTSVQFIREFTSSIYKIINYIFYEEHRLS